MATVGLRLKPARLGLLPLDVGWPLHSAKQRAITNCVPPLNSGQELHAPLR